MRRLQSLTLLVFAVAALAGLPASASPAETTGLAQVPNQPGPVLLPADDYTSTAVEPLAPGQIELAVTSTRSTIVTGGDARMEVRGLDDGDTLRVVLDNGEDLLDVSDVFGRTGSVADGVVAGFADGPNLVTATVNGPAGERQATLEVVNYPIHGPVFTGPRVGPFICETEESNLGPPIDEHCSIEPRVQWFARSLLGEYTELTDPYGEYPPDTGMARTRHGEIVPFVVRVESVTINRSITRIGILDDPAVRGPDASYVPSAGWNGSVIHQFGESCGTRFGQGQNQIEHVMSGLFDSLAALDAENIAGVIADIPSRLADGYAWVHSTQTVLGVHCNPGLTAETLAMVREHIIERYGPIEHTLGVGASGGAIQQYTTIDSYPGLLDGGAPILSFPDVATTAMSVVDCGLLQRVFQSDENRWSEEKQTAVTGFVTAQICDDWVDQFLSRLDPIRNCGRLPEEDRYHPEDHIDGVRCTVQDNLMNLVGTDADHPHAARRPVDNVGVQYGLEALQAGDITPADFIEVNQAAGGFDIDANWVPERMAMDQDLAETLYRYGGVSGRGALAGAPTIDLNIYADLIPVLGFHDQVRAHIVSDRLAERGQDGSHANWTGLPLPADVFATLHDWADAIDAAYQPGDDRAQVVAAAAPPGGHDRCAVTTSPPTGFGALTPELQQVVGLLFDTVPADICEQVVEGLLVGATPRMTAGGPSTEDIIKCRLRPIDDSDYPGFSAVQLEELREVFPAGVCDWTQPGVGQEVDTVTWTSLGASELATEPFHVADVVARSSTAPAVVGEPSVQDDGVSVPVEALPRTGGNSWIPIGLVLALAAFGVVGFGRRVRARS